MVPLASMKATSDARSWLRYRVLRLRQIGDGEQVVRLEIGNDDGGTVFQDLLGLGGNVAVGRDDVLDEVVFLAEKLTALVVVLNGEARPLQTVVGEYGVDERERNRLLIFLAEIVDGDLDRGRFRLGGRRVIGRASAEADQHEKRRERRKSRAAPARRNGKLQGVHMSKMGYREPSKLGTSLTNWLAGASVAASMAARG